MVKIFAKHHTNQKVLIVCSQQEVTTIQRMLSNTYGGNWLLVDNLNPGEHLLFEDEQVYHGFSADIKRYSSCIKKE